jgi:uncharacterized 2Fe-2S/4Fe-4S cluster protein (DUF4445 family)
MLSQELRQGEGKMTAVIWMEREILDIRPGRVDDLYGLAIDVGTTTVAGYLCNLRTGEVISTQSMMNPQIPYGEDVMSRITYTVAHQEGLEKIHRSIIDGLNQLIKTMMEDCHLHPEDILELSMVGNTTMHHLLLKLDPQYLGIPPFAPTIHQSVDVKARDFGLELLPSANVHMLPIEAGFVGADTVCPHPEEPINRIDGSPHRIGTNGELVLENKERLLNFRGNRTRFKGAHQIWHESGARGDREVK